MTKKLYLFEVKQDYETLVYLIDKQDLNAAFRDATDNGQSAIATPIYFNGKNYHAAKKTIKAAADILNGVNTWAFSLKEDQFITRWLLTNGARYGLLKYFKQINLI